jgi:hypothetical protein
VATAIEQSQGEVVAAQNGLVNDGRLGMLIAMRSRKRKLGGMVKAVILGRTNKTLNYVCVSRVSKVATQALHFPAKLGIR